MKNKRKKRQIRNIDQLQPKKHNPAVKDGRVLAVLRPADPSLAIREAKRIHRDPLLSDREFTEQFAAILQKQEYTFVGIAGADGRSLLNEAYEPLNDEMQPGDSFVPYEQVAALIAAQGETKA